MSNDNPSSQLISSMSDLVALQLKALVLNEAEAMERFQTVLKASIDRHYQLLCFIRARVFDQPNLEGEDMDSLVRAFERLHPMPQILKPEY